ncbi:MAG TPA: phenylalanine--tRNA ligase subunit beta, partial [Bacteroidales bacterium]|nr:phenylalanine--tRNA ligase subunit beta [Bacteroidales bacterium]
HGLKTDASFRFERGADPNITPWALKRAILLIKEIAGGQISSDIVDVYPTPIKNNLVDVSYYNINRLIGKKIEPQVVKKIFSLLDIKIISENDSQLTVEIPSYRVDVKQEADVIEEILRIYGYNNVEINMHVNSTLTYPEKPNKEKIVNIISDSLSANGYSEIMCNSLCPSAWYEENDDFDKDQLVILANPLSSDLNAMRQTLLFGGLSSIKWNLNRQNPDLKLYEFGKCYFYHKKDKAFPSADNFTEKTSLDLFISGNTGPQSWNSKTNPSDFFNIKSSVEMIFSRLGIKDESLKTGETDKKYLAESSTWMFNNKLVAEAGRVSKFYLSKFDIGQDVYWAHIDWDSIMKLIKTHSITFRELPKYPSVKRDLALLLDKGIKFSQIRDIAYHTEKNLLQDINLFDVYESDSLGKNKKSYAVSFLLRDDLKTMTDKNIDRIMNNLIKAFETELNAQIR